MFYSLDFNSFLTNLNSKRKFIIDTSPGLNDARALIYALNYKEIDIIAITITGGHASLTQGIQNVTHLLNATQRKDITIFSGSCDTYSGTTTSIHKYFGKDAMGDLGIPTCAMPTYSSIPAPHALVSLSNIFDGNITIVALGPLTNLAKAYDIDYTFPGRISNFFIYGQGNYKYPHKLHKIYESLNYSVDPEAARLVLDNFGRYPGTCVYVVDFLLCKNFPIENKFFEKTANAIPNIKEKIYQKLLLKKKITDPHETTSKGQEKTILMACNNELIISTRKVSLTMIATTEDKISHAYFKNDRNGKVTLIEEMNIKAALQMYSYVLKNQPKSLNE